MPNKRVTSLEDIRNYPKLNMLCETNDILYLGVFGSFACNEATPKSDIDFLVRFSETKSLFELVRMQREFTRAFGRKVELLTEAAISPYIRDRVKSQVKVVYEKTQ